MLDESNSDNYLHSVAMLENLEEVSIERRAYQADQAQGCGIMPDGVCHASCVLG